MRVRTESALRSAARLKPIGTRGFPNGTLQRVLMSCTAQRCCARPLSVWTRNSSPTELCGILHPSAGGDSRNAFIAAAARSRVVAAQFLCAEHARVVRNDADSPSTLSEYF